MYFNAINNRDYLKGLCVFLGAMVLRQAQQLIALEDIIKQKTALFGQPLYFITEYKFH
jgi:hypothetical protein